MTLSARLCELIKVAADVENDLRREERLVQYQSCLPTGKRAHRFGYVGLATGGPPQLTSEMPEGEGVSERPSPVM